MGVFIGLTLKKRRHAFYENDEKVTLEIFDKGVDASKVEIVFKPRSVSAICSSMCCPVSRCGG